MIECNGEEWFSISGSDKEGWFVSYSKIVNKFFTEELIEVRSKYRYVSFLKMLWALWKMRKKIKIKVGYE